MAEEPRRRCAVSSEGSEPEDEYYFEPEIFTAASARIYDPYDRQAGDGERFGNPSLGVG